MYSRLLLTLLALNLIARNFGDPDVLVETINGYVRGRTSQSPSGRLVDVFLGIPYAKAPIGNRRFKPPLPPENWDQALNASSLPHSCYQRVVPLLRLIPSVNKWLPTTPVSEDCLKLNVWVPKPRPANGTVMVFIHGGGFSFGSTTPSVFDGSVLASEENVIVVTIQYRLASLGFLYIDLEHAPGNMGLLDQTLALKWVQLNIGRFGGDPGKVTIFGQSAGAVSVGYHLVSPESHNLFRYAILESGGATADWALQSKETNYAKGKQLARNLGCPEGAKERLECLQKVDVDDLITNEPINADRPYDLHIFQPIIDGQFLTDHPKNLFKKKSFKKTHLLIGTNRNEGTYFLTGLLPSVFQYSRDHISVSRDNFEEIVHAMVGNKSNLLLNTVEFQYTYWRNPDHPLAYLQSADRMMSDVLFTCTVNYMCGQYDRSGQSVFRYFFTHRTEHSDKPLWLGTPHGEEIPYVFGEPMNSRFNYTKDEIGLSRRMMTYWANFAKTGDPNLSPNGIPATIWWPNYRVTDKSYLVLAPNSTVVGNGFREKMCAFWEYLVPQFP